MNCPSCNASLPRGETICLECGTELTLGAPQDGSAEAPAGAGAATGSSPATRAESQAPVAAAQLCPDCGERVAMDANGLCPVCGHDFGDSVDLDEDTFFEIPPSLEAAMAAERARLAELGENAARAASTVSARAASPVVAAAVEPQEAVRTSSVVVTATVSLPGDQERRMPVPSHAAAQQEEMWLVVEGGQTVFFDGRMVSRIRLDMDELSLGRRDPASGHYPDIDLGHFRHIDPHISRHHARVYKRQGRWFLEDLCTNDSTYLNDTAHVLNGETVEFRPGDRVLISESVALRLVDRDSDPGAGRK